MTAGRGLHRRLAWLALCVMVFGALAPSISRVLSTTRDVAWVEVCSANGLQRVVLDLGIDKGPAGPRADDGHCGYCVLQKHSPVLASSLPAWVTATPASDRLPVGTGGTTIVKRFPRDAHRPRGPPPSFS